MSIFLYYFSVSIQGKLCRIDTSSGNVTPPSNTFWKDVSDSMLIQNSPMTTDTQNTSEVIFIMNSLIIWNLIQKEIEIFLSEQRISLDSNPVKWWKDNHIRFPNMSKLARKYLCAPPTSVPSERLFSAAGNIYNAKRNRLLGEKCQQLLFIKNSLKQFNY